MPQQEEKQGLPVRLDESSRGIIGLFVINPIVMHEAHDLFIYNKIQLAPAAFAAEIKQILALRVDAILHLHM